MGNSGHVSFRIGYGIILKDLEISNVTLSGEAGYNRTSYFNLCIGFEL